MFESPPRFYLDPWASEYGSALEAELDEPGPDEPGEPPDTGVETSDWYRPIVPEPVPRPQRIAFVDGVQRIDAFGRVATADHLAEAALASLAVGTSITEEPSASVQFAEPCRVLALSGGVSGSALAVPAGGTLLHYEPESADRPGPSGIRLAIERRRRELERRFAEGLASPDALVVLDGRLSFDPSGATPVVGFAKTLHRFYLRDPELALLPLLEPGQRTPVFRIHYGDTTRYSWFLRLPHTRPIHHPFAGIVRLETTEIGAAAAIALANLTSFHLPAFASRPEHDPRAPQNLMPIAALERRLRHEMGDPLYLRRAIEDYLHQEAVA